MMVVEENNNNGGQGEKSRMKHQLALGFRHRWWLGSPPARIPSYPSFLFENVFHLALEQWLRTYSSAIQTHQEIKKQACRTTRRSSTNAVLRVTGFSHV